MSYYAVKVGRVVGVYTNWLDCKKQIDKFKGPVYKKFSEYEDAVNFVHSGVMSYYEKKHAKSALVIKDLEYDKEKTIYVDGGFNKHTKPYGFGCVVNSEGVDLIENNLHLLTDMQTKRVDLPVGSRTVILAYFKEVQHQNNAAELLAMVAGLRIAIYYLEGGKYVKNIASDSNLIVLYWSKKIKAETEESSDPIKVKYIKELIELRKRFESMQGNIIKISGDDNPADLGYHISK